MDNELEIQMLAREVENWRRQIEAFILSVQDGREMIVQLRLMVEKNLVKIEQLETKNYPIDHFGYSDESPCFENFH